MKRACFRLLLQSHPATRMLRAKDGERCSPKKRKGSLRRAFFILETPHDRQRD
jgi:hypothetical protein